MVLALVLCLLAVLFAVEAKTAWYSPSGGSASAVSAAKARPAELPVVVSHGVSAPDAGLQLSFVLLAAIAAGLHVKIDGIPNRVLAQNHNLVFTAAFFSPSLFFRPPPAV